MDLPDTRENADDLSCVGSYADEAAAQEHALVILAMGQPCWIHHFPEDEHFTLHAAAELAPEIHAELDAYEEESAQAAISSEPEPSPFSHSAGWGLYGLWLCLLVFILLAQQRHPWLVELGASSSIRLVEHHEWWRPFTALFLHADGSHLLGNLLSALFFATLVCRLVGPWLGWLMILGCGALGNLATSLSVWPDAYRSIGASTATFAALGILSGLGFSWMFKHRLKLPWLRLSAPVLAGIVVLGMTGAGLPADNTDVLGHVFGFIAGTLSGAAHGMLAESLTRASSCGTSKAESDGPT